MRSQSVTGDHGSVPVESILARHTVARAVYVAPVLIAIFWITNGWDGAWSAALGVGIVVVNFLLAGAILSISAKISLTVYHAAALFGFFLRLGLMVLTVLLLAQFLPIDRIAFGISAVAAYLVLLSWEAVAISKGRERNLDWIP
ncbi:MAG TPA: ATP synthase subunit I [Acidimicrobiia bacterium]|nr:ATP synthase subunit I [Acidimicrobiia bacterium]